MSSEESDEYSGEDMELDYLEDENVQKEEELLDSEEEYSRKKRKRKANPFLALEAEVDHDEDDDDDEEEEEEEDFIENDPSEQYKMPSLKLERRVDEPSYEEMERIGASMERKYGRSSRRQHTADRTQQPQQLLLPSVRDPKLWMIRCKEGREKDIVMTILRKRMEQSRQSKRFQTDARGVNFKQMKILSCFSREDLRGTIYVEANVAAHVTEALEGVSGVYMRNSVLVPVKEMVDVVSIKKKDKTAELLRKEWVRVKRGKYQGDLAKIIDVSDAGQQCTIHIVPRLSFKKNSGKPPQKLFDRKDLPSQLQRQVTVKAHGYFLFGPETFKDGYLQKQVRTNQLDTEGLPPTLDEIKLFTQEKLEGDVLKNLKNAFESRDVTLFNTGDQVEVIDGELANVSAVISSISGSVAEITSIGPLFTKTSVPLVQLRKRFSLGDLVRVVGGRHSSQTGTIVHCQNNIATLITPEMEEIEVFFRDLQDAREMAKANALRPIPLKKSNVSLQRRKKDDLIGKTVKLRVGQYKGFLAVVKQVNELNCLVELTAQAKQITVAKSSICDEQHRNVRQKPATPHQNRTPKPVTPSATPRKSIQESRTPGWESGARTPHHPLETDYEAWITGSKTPHYADPNSSTPAYVPNFQNEWNDEWGNSWKQ